MNELHRARLAFHGAVALMVGLICGVIAVTEPEGQPMPSWQAAHGGLLLNGIWLLAVAGVAHRLVLERSLADGLFWSLLGMVYGFMETVLIQASFGVRGISFEGSLPGRLAFVGNLVVALCSVVSAGLILTGARGWVLQARPRATGLQLERNGG
jgi:hypothetical protein